MKNTMPSWLPRNKKVMTLEESLVSDLQWLLRWPGWVYKQVRVVEVSEMSSYILMSDELPATLVPSFVDSSVNLQIHTVSAVLSNQQQSMIIQYKDRYQGQVLGRAFVIAGDIDKEQKYGKGWTWVD